MHYIRIWIEVFLYQHNCWVTCAQ